MTIVVTRNAPERIGGFLASCMLEVAPGVYLGPRLRRSVRDRIWQVLDEWSSLLPADGGVLILWPSKAAPSGLAMKIRGFPKARLISSYGLWLRARPLTEADDLAELLTLAQIRGEEGA